MAGFSERLKVILDVDTPGLSGLKKFGQAIREAEGPVAKFKAGFGSAMESAKANAGGLALVAGAALTAFAVKAVGAFTDTAKAAIDLSKATGLSVEQASRWIAVGDDFGVTADQLAGAIGKIGKDLDSAKWDKYGIATRDASGVARDANDILMDVLETLNNTAPAERAKVGAELLGRGWQSVAPILGHTRAEYEKMLGSVEDGQVITKKEAERAEKMRLAQDSLSDALGELTLAFGGAVAEAAPFVEVLADGITLVGDFTGMVADATAQVKRMGDSGALGSLSDSLREASLEGDLASVTLEELKASLIASGASVLESAEALVKWQEAQDAATAAAEGGKDAFEQLGAALDWIVTVGDTATDTIGSASTATNELTDAGKGAADELVDMAEALDDAADAGEGLEKHLKGVRDILDELNEQTAALDLADQMDATKKAAEEAFFAGVNGAEDFEQAQRDAQREAIELKRKVIEYGDSIGGIPAEKLTEINALIDAGDVDAVQRELDRLTQARTVTLFLNAVPTGSGYGGGGSGGAPTGGNGAGNVSGKNALTDGRTDSAGLGRGADGDTYSIAVTVNAGIGSDGQAIGDQAALAVMAAIERVKRGTR